MPFVIQEESNDSCLIVCLVGRSNGKGDLQGSERSP